MLNDVIKPGDKLDIRQVGHKDGRQYASKLFDIKEDNIISIAMPFEKSQVILLNVGEEYNITFYTGKGLFAAKAVVHRRYKVNNIFVAEVQLIENLKKVQRREYYRFQCVIELKYWEVAQRPFSEVMKSINMNPLYDGMSEIQKKTKAIDILRDLETESNIKIIKTNKGIVTDISGGGLKFNTTKEIDTSKELFLEFSINNGLRMIIAFGNVLATEKSLERSNFYSHRLMFTDINDEQREEIVRYIFNEERMIRQKEKGLR